MSEKQTSEELKPLRLCGYCKVWNRRPCGEVCCLQPTDPTEEILNRSPDPRMLEVLREARELINDDTKCENNTDPIGNCDDLWPYTKKLCRRCKLRYRIDAVLGGSHKVEPFKEGSD